MKDSTGMLRMMSALNAKLTNVLTALEKIPVRAVWMDSWYLLTDQDASLLLETLIVQSRFMISHLD